VELLHLFQQIRDDSIARLFQTGITGYQNNEGMIEFDLIGETMLTLGGTSSRHTRLWKDENLEARRNVIPPTDRTAQPSFLIDEWDRVQQSINDNLIETIVLGYACPYQLVPRLRRSRGFASR
jgi:hypothetical protein